MHYSNVSSGSEKLGIIGIFRKTPAEHIFVLSKSKNGTNEKGEFPAIRINTQEEFHPLFVDYKGDSANIELGAKTAFCDLPEGLQTKISEILFKGSNNACL